MPFKAVLFDLDGTLLDTIQDISRSMNIVLNGYGYPTHSLEDYKLFVGDGIHNLAIRCLPVSEKNPVNIKKIIEAMRIEYKRHFFDHTRPYEGIPELLKQLTEKKLSLSVLSNKPHPATIEIIQHFFPHHHFDFIAGAKPHVPVKPDPTASSKIVLMSGFNPEEFLYLGDTATDMLTAVNTGMYPVGALWGFRSAEELKSSGAKKLIEKPLELLNLIES